MSKIKLQGKELRALGYPEGPVISVAMNLVEKNCKHESRELIMDTLKDILASPHNYLEHELWAPVAAKLVPAVKNREEAEISMNTHAVPFSIYGQEHIEEGALHQMYTAAKIPVAVAGALMPDAHSGYGLPIGGVLATENAVIPYGVGVDIGCRMCLSIYDINPTELDQRKSFFARELGEATLFGSGARFDRASNHAIMEDSAFYSTPLLKSLHGKAWKQLGSSGSGNHFVEFGEVHLTEKDEQLGVEAGRYLGLLSHSGSRGLGANIATHYTKLAKQKRKLPGEASNLAWLSLDEEEGMEYWIAMNLAGEYASACHHIIHDKIAKQLGRRPIGRVENHHNFAWKEMIDGRELIVHRKGATPAGKNVLGIIPGSMTANGYIVKGKGEPGSLFSASHGAGRKMSRSKAMNSITKHALTEILESHGVTLMGGGLDEAPFAYKNITEVMASQGSLVDTIGTFTPRIVKMDGAPHRGYGKKNRAE